MCGRFALAAGHDEIASHFDAHPAHQGLWTWKTSFNLAPAVVAPVVALNGEGDRALVPMRWGLHPHWRKEMPEGRPLFNARVETAHEKPSFRTPWKRRRCLVPISGWYEWEGVTRPKTPHYIHPKEEGLTALVGLWDQWRVDEGVTLLSFTILTTPANGPIKHLHHRMPVRLPENQWQNWLDPDVKTEKVISYMLTGDDLDHHEVSKAVNSGRAEGPNLILKVVE